MIPVLWLSFYKETPNKGYWDMGMLELIFEGKLYNPAIGYQYDNREVDTIPSDLEGAVVVIPARYHTNDISRLNKELARLKWVLLILANDEESTFAREKLRHPNMKVYVMTPRPKQDKKPYDMLIPLGFPKDTRELLKAAKVEAMERPLDYWFSGQITHSRRRALVKSLHTIVEFEHVNKLKGEWIETEGFTQGIPHDLYYKMMASAKAVPCASGPVTPDTFRFYEALEAGCVPVVDDMTPAETSAKVNNFYNYLFDEYKRYSGADLPFPIFTDYEHLQGKLVAIRDEYPKWNNRVFAWWQQYKRWYVHKIVDDIQELSGHEPTAPDRKRLVTVLVPTSTTPDHPDTAMIEQTISDIRAQLPESEIIIMVDGIRKEQKSRTKSYDEYKRRLLWLCNHEWRNVLPLIFEEHMHQASMAREALKLVRTPLMMYVEHDAPVVPDRIIEWDWLIEKVLCGEANIIRLLHEERIQPEHWSMMLDKEPCGIPPMLRTMQWSQRPHLASTSFYRWMIDAYFHPESKTMIEDVMHGIVHSHIEREGEMGWNLWRLWIYCPNTDSIGIKRSYHLDGRQHDQKYDMIIKPVNKR